MKKQAMDLLTHNSDQTTEKNSIKSGGECTRENPITLNLALD
jgi:hypothetical protein